MKAHYKKARRLPAGSYAAKIVNVKPGKNGTKTVVVTFRIARFGEVKQTFYAGV